MYVCISNIRLNGHVNFINLKNIHFNDTFNILLPLFFGEEYNL